MTWANILSQSRCRHCGCPPLLSSKTQNTKRSYFTGLYVNLLKCFYCAMHLHIARYMLWRYVCRAVSVHHIETAKLISNQLTSIAALRSSCLTPYATNMSMNLSSDVLNGTKDARKRWWFHIKTMRLHCTNRTRYRDRVSVDINRNLDSHIRPTVSKLVLPLPLTWRILL